MEVLTSDCVQRSHSIGKLFQKEGVFFKRAREVRVETRPGLEFTVDGEVIGDEPADFVVIPRTLKVIVGPKYTPEPEE